MNLKYWLDGSGEKMSTVATAEELETARNAAHDRLVRKDRDYAMRSCWNCNPAHEHFLRDLTDGFLMACFDCGHWYYQGVDITTSAPEEELTE